MKKQYVVLELRNSAAMTKLRDENKRLRDELERLKQRFNQLEVKYGYEVLLNGEIVDLLNQHHIPYRDALDRAKRR